MGVEEPAKKTEAFVPLCLCGEMFLKSA